MLTLPYDSAIVHVVVEFGVYRKNGKREKVVLLVRETNDTWGTVGGGREEEDNNDVEVSYNYESDSDSRGVEEATVSTTADEQEEA